jgi:hypothetical protein
MNDRREQPSPETPIQRALRLKNEAREARPKGRGLGFNREDAARMPSGASKPWLKR